MTIDARGRVQVDFPNVPGDMIVQRSEYALDADMRHIVGRSETVDIDRLMCAIVIGMRSDQQEMVLLLTDATVFHMDWYTLRYAFSCLRLPFVELEKA